MMFGKIKQVGAQDIFCYNVFILKPNLYTYVRNSITRNQKNTCRYQRLWSYWSRIFQARFRTARIRNRRYDFCHIDKTGKPIYPQTYLHVTHFTADGYAIGQKTWEYNPDYGGIYVIFNTQGVELASYRGPTEEAYKYLNDWLNANR